MKYTNQKMYNGRMITNTINKPLLHKKGKLWIVVGLSALMLAGFGGAIGLGHSTVHADTNTVQTSINKNLVQNNKQSSSSSSNNTQNSANASNSNKAISTSTSEVTDQAKNLHANLLANATLAPVTGTNDSANNGQKNNQANPNKQEEAVNEPEVGNTSGSWEGLNYTSDGNGTVIFTGTLTGSTSNHNPSDFFDEGKYEHSLPVNAVTQAKKIVFGTNSDPVDFSSQDNLQDMFDGASDNNIQEIDFNKVTGMNNVTNMHQMFGGSTTNPNLKTIYLGKGFDMSNVTSDSDMFGTGQPVDTNYNITVSSLNTYGNLKPDVMSQVKMPNIPNMQTGNYDGLNYIYDPNTSTVMFTSGDLSWNKGVGITGNYGNQDFIGGYSNRTHQFNDENPSESYGQDAPSFMNTAKHIVFRNIDFSKDIISDGGRQFGNGRFMFANDPNVESIDLGPDFVNRKLMTQSGYTGYTITNIFQSDTNLKSITIPYGFIASNDNATNAFTGDNKLQQINILPSPNSIPASNKINGQTKFASNDGLSGNWRQGGQKQSNIINTPLQPGTYINESTEPKPFDFINFVHKYEPNTYPSDRSDHDVAIPDFVHDSFKEGTSTVKYNTDDDTITFNGGTLANNISDNAHSSLAIPTRIKDITTGKWVPSDLLPNNNSDWTIRFNNVTAPNSIYFDLDGKNEHESTYSGHQYAGMTTSQREKVSRNFIGNQVSNIDLSGLNTNGTTNMEGFMINDTNLKHVNFGNINTSKVTNMAMMLGSDVSLPYVDLSNLNGKSLNEAWDMLYNCRSLQGVKLSSQFSPHYQNNNPIKTNGNDTSDQGSDAVNLGEMFGSDPSLQFRNIDWNGFNTNKVTAFYGMFRSDYNLGKIDLPASFDTSNGINFGHSVPQRSQEAKDVGPDGMFQSDFSTTNNKGVTSIDLGPSFDTSKATNIAAMFRADKALKTIKFRNKFDTSNVNDMQQMFGFSDPISDLSLPAGFDTRKAYNNNPSSPNNGQARMFESDKLLNTITIYSPHTIFNGNDNSSISNGSNNKYSYNAWGYVSDSNGHLNSNPEPELYRENGKKDANGKPTTLANSHDFSSGKDGSYNGLITGTFTTEDLNPGVANLHPSDTDTIIFTDNTSGDSGYGKSWHRISFGQDTTRGNVIPLIPTGYKLANNQPNFTYDNGLHYFDVVSKNQPNTNIPVLENAVNVQGTIKLVFNKGHNEHDIYLPYSEQQTFSDGSRDILNDAEITASKPSDYVSKTIKNFNTTGYQYDNNANNSDINFTPNATQAIYNNGSTPLIRHDVELDYSGNSENETVKFIYTHPSGSQSTVHSDSKSGTNGEQSRDNYMPAGYHMDPNSSAEYIFENGGTHIINIIPNWTNATVNYEVNGSGTPVRKATLSGNNSSATDASDTSTNITNTYHPGLPSGYSVNGNTTVKFNNGTYTINVTPASDTDEVVFRGDNDADYSVSGSKGTTETINPPEHFHFVGNNSNDNQNGSINNNHQGQFTLNNGHHYFDVARNSNTMNINFSDGNGNSFPSRQDTGLSDTSDVVVAPDNYHFSDGHGHNSKSTVIKYNNGNYNNNPLQVVGDKVNDDIVYVDNSGNYVSDKPVSGNYGVNDTTDIHAPNGYNVKSGQSTSFRLDNGTHIIKVVGNKTDNIIYLDAQGNIHGSTSQSGASDANPIDITSAKQPGIEPGYQVLSGDHKFNYDGLTHVVPVKGSHLSANNNITVDVHRIINGNSDSKTITLTRSGNVGSDIAIKPDDTDIINNSALPHGYLNNLVPDGRDYPRVGKFTANGKVSGINGTINFYYDKNSTNGNAITVNYKLNGNTISSGSFSKPNNTSGYVTSDVSIPAGYSTTSNTSYKATNDPQTINVAVKGIPANQLPSDTNQGKVRLNLIFEDNNGNVQKVVTEYPNNVSNTKVGSDFTVNAPGETGYRQTSGGSQFKGHIYSYGAFPDTHSFVYQANSATTTVHFNNQNGSDVTPTGAHNNANGCTNGPANITLPFGYRLPIGTSYHFNSDNQLVDSNNQPASNPLHVVGDKIVGNAKLHLIYKDGSNVSDETATVPISGEVGGTATINPYNYLKDNYQLNTSEYDGTGLAGRLTVNFTPSDVTNSDQHGFAYDPVYTFEYDSTTKKLKDSVDVVYINIDKQPHNKVVGNQSLGKFSDNSIGDKVLLAAKNTGVNNDKYYYDLTVPNGYHLEHTYNPITLTDDPAHAQATATRLGISIPNNVGMLLTVNLASTGAKPNKPTSSSADNHNHKPAKPSSSSASSSSSVPNKPAKPASSSASSSNNVPPAPNSNSNGGGSISPSSNGGGFIPNGGGYVPVPIPYPTPTPASNADNTPHNSTTVLPGSTTNNYYDNDNNTTNNYYNNRSSKSSDFSSNHKIGKANNLRDLNEVGVNHSVYYHGYKITRLNVPARFRWIYIIKTCLAHKDLVNYGDHQYWAVLRPNHRITLRINKVFKTQRGKKTYYNYEVRIGRHNAFVTSYSTYTRNAYYQPTDLRRTRSHGIFHHYYRARLILNNGLYRSRYYTGRTFVRELHRGKIVHIKRIITIGRKGDFQTRFQLTNGDYITSNKNWIKLL